MKYCSRCGTELVDEAVICTKCGCLVSNEVGQFGEFDEIESMPKRKTEAYNFSASISVIDFISSLLDILCVFFALWGILGGMIALDMDIDYNNILRYSYDDGYLVTALVLAVISSFCKAITLIFSLMNREKTLPFVLSHITKLISVLAVILALILMLSGVISSNFIFAN